MSEPDRVAGAPHPRETAVLFGHAAAEAAFAQAWAEGRPHHAWLIRGPRGVGKATLAYRMARAVLSARGPLATLAVDPAHPDARLVAAGAHPGLRTLTRPVDQKTGKIGVAINVEQARRLKDFFQLSAADGGWRVVVVDAAEEMNGNCANALLKTLEEPPPRCLILLVAHAAGRLPPTIRSRCRTLDLGPLTPEDVARALTAAGAPPGPDAPALAALAQGAPGVALALAAVDGPALYARLVALAQGAPGLDRGALTQLAEAAAGREARALYGAIADMTVLLAQRLARAGAGAPAPEAAPGEAALARRLAPDLAAARLWAAMAAEAQGLADRARAVNLDPSQTILDIWLRIDAAAARGPGR